MGTRRAASSLALTIAAFAISACGGSSRDVVPPTHDVAVTGVQAQGSYLFVAKRPLGFVALASEDGLGIELATSAVEHLADRMNGCATELAKRGRLVDGAVRVTVLVHPDGSVDTTRVTVAPGDAVAANALLCVMAPIKMLTFAPAGDGKGRAFAVDATWGPGASSG